MSNAWLDASEPVARKKLGQYMTPSSVASALIDLLDPEPGMRVLDPGVGTGELLRALLDREPGVEAVGWDIDETVLAAAARLVPEVNLERRSALDPTEPGRFDLVIGNPPYFQLGLGTAGRNRFREVLSGRANIFALFFQVGMEQLRPGGKLAFIVPPSMNSGAYFEGLREYLVARSRIRHLRILPGTDLFDGANTAVQLLVVEKSGPGPGFFFRREVPEAAFRRTVFSAEPDRLAREFDGRSTLWEMGLEASTGQVVWNANRKRLKPRPGRHTVRLYWSHDIGSGELLADSSKAGKHAYYDTSNGGREPLTGPAIVVNRVVGAVGRGELRAALVPAGQEFLAENHVNVILPRRNGGGAGTAAPEVDWEAVLSALLEPGVVDRIRLLTGNTQISARELTHLLPLG